jgi:hypothetical protein
MLSACARAASQAQSGPALPGCAGPARRRGHGGGAAAGAACSCGSRESSSGRGRGRARVAAVGGSGRGGGGAGGGHRQGAPVPRQGWRGARRGRGGSAGPAPPCRASRGARSGLHAALREGGQVRPPARSRRSALNGAALPGVAQPPAPRHAARSPPGHARGGLAAHRLHGGRAPAAQRRAARQGARGEAGGREAAARCVARTRRRLFPQHVAALGPPLRAPCLYTRRRAPPPRSPPQAIDENLRHPQPYIQRGAVAAVAAYARCGEAGRGRGRAQGLRRAGGSLPHPHTRPSLLPNPTLPAPQRLPRGRPPRRRGLPQPLCRQLSDSLARSERSGEPLAAAERAAGRPARAGAQEPAAGQHSFPAARPTGFAARPRPPAPANHTAPCGPQVRRGYSLALGSLPAPLLLPMLDEVRALGGTARD